MRSRAGGLPPLPRSRLLHGFKLSRSAQAYAGLHRSSSTSKQQAHLSASRAASLAAPRLRSRRSRTAPPSRSRSRSRSRPGSSSGTARARSRPLPRQRWEGKLVCTLASTVDSQYQSGLRTCCDRGGARDRASLCGRGMHRGSREYRRASAPPPADARMLAAAMALVRKSN